jgi:hypothetical protein
MKLLYELFCFIRADQCLSSNSSSTITNSKYRSASLSWCCKVVNTDINQEIHTVFSEPDPSTERKSMSCKEPIAPD